jgi:hypothetical protein
MRTKFWSESLKGRDHLEYLDVNGRIILRWILGNEVGGCGLNLPSSGKGPVAGCSENGNEPSLCTNRGQFLV